METHYLSDQFDHVRTVARWHFEEWGYLDETIKLEHFERGIKCTLRKSEIPITFIATNGDQLTGSVSLVKHENKLRKDLSPWLACLFVDEQAREIGVGKELCNRLLLEAKKLGYSRIYLECFPDLVNYYLRQGWVVLEESNYLGKNVIIMYFDVLA